MLRHITEIGLTHKNSLIISACCVLLLLSGCGQQQQSKELLGDFTLDVPIAYVKRPIDTTNGTTPLGGPRDEHQYAPGGNLYYRDFASTNAQERNLTDAYTALDAVTSQSQFTALTKTTAGDVTDPSPSYDGNKILFSMKIGEFQNATTQPTWNIWEYDRTDGPNGSLHRVIGGDISAEAGNDFAPAYLPDGRIIFLSDRQVETRKLLTQDLNIAGVGIDPLTTPIVNERSRTTTSYTLHVMDADGSNIHQISFSQSSDLSPSVLMNGKVLFSRWEAAGKNQFDIFHANPDGTGLDILYGANSHSGSNGRGDPAFVDPREMPSGKLIATLMPSTGTFNGGDLVTIDAQNYLDINTPRITNASNQSQGQVSVTGGLVPSAAGFSPYGRYTSPFPMWDGTNRLLVSWTPCLAQLDNGNPNVINTNPVVVCPSDTTGYVQAQPMYHVVIVDLDHGTQKPIVMPEPNVEILQPIALVNRVSTGKTPQYIADKSTALGGGLDPDLASAGVGAVDIRSVYDTTSFSGIGMTNLISPETLVCTTPNQACANGNTADLATMANPNYVTMPVSVTNTTIPKRPARFVRVITAMPTVSGEPRAAYGISNATLRTIAGYAPVQPDGSAYMEIPANTAFQVEVLDDHGRRFAGHNDWMQVKPGEILHCNGCHSSIDGRDSINPGADAYPGDPNNTGNVPVTFFNGAVTTAVSYMDDGTGNMVPAAGETMAETLVDLSCITDPGICPARSLSSDLEYTDVWTPGLTAASPQDISIKYPTTNFPSPITSVSTSPVTNCVGSGTIVASWTANCRISISYENNIAPLWSTTTNRPGGVSCVSCHTTTAGTLVPPGGWQLDLDDSDTAAMIAIRNAVTDWSFSYQELVGQKNELTIDPTSMLVAVAQDPVTTTVVDASGNTVSTTTFVDRQLNNNLSIISRFSARRSYLIEKLTETELNATRTLSTAGTDPTYVNHMGMMTDAEIRLLSEWIDIGAPYYSEPISPQ